jgi:hypothetical protein
VVPVTPRNVVPVTPRNVVPVTPRNVVPVTPRNVVPVTIRDVPPMVALVFHVELDEIRGAPAGFCPPPLALDEAVDLELFQVFPYGPLGELRLASERRLRRPAFPVF